MLCIVSNDLAVAFGAAGIFFASFLTSIWNWVKLNKVGVQTEENHVAAVRANEVAIRSQDMVSDKINSVFETLKNIEVQVDGRTTRFEARLKALEDTAKEFSDHITWSLVMKNRLEALEDRVGDIEKRLSNKG